jgi:uncharacterized protein
MPSPPVIDLSQVAAGLGLSPERVTTVVELLDGGNTVPFITRYRKDQTGGLDEEQIRHIQARVAKLRLLQERKQTILRSIESQGKLTPQLAADIEAAATNKRLEDLYLPYKPRKQTLATLARTRGLENLATEILAADPACADLDARAADFVNSDRQVFTPADALLGAGHILAEMFSERLELREKLRAILAHSGHLVSTAVEPEVRPENKSEGKSETKPESKTETQPLFPSMSGDDGDAAAEAADVSATDVAPPVEIAESSAAESESAIEPAPEVPLHPTAASNPGEGEAPAEPESSTGAIEDGSTDSGVTDGVADSVAMEGSAIDGGSAGASPSHLPALAHTESAPAPAAPAKQQSKKTAKAKQKERDKDREQRAFRDYFHYSEALNKVPPHRVLAINRGERAKVLRVKVEADQEAMLRLVDELLVPADHPHAEFLRGCARDALTRLVLPSLEREVRRELTDHAELHAVEVFARNLRNLLLQPPIRDRRVLAIDPGFKSGCKLVALDEFGNLLDHAVIHLVGKEERRAEAKTRLIELVNKHQSSVIAIGNGTACRQVEQWISDLLAGELAEQKVAYVIVNEAGASVYSTSRLGREEFPKYDATLRGAISIGRRLQDPLSELVKIDPANIGVGMYQHDVKAKHLRESLDAVVESCVNYVGVDLNTASPALLRYVSGLNQLTAQRLYDFRTANGPFKSREQLNGITGFGESTFVQAAGFLKIVAGDNPLDATWIHPESYPATLRVLEKLGASSVDLADSQRATELAERAAQLNVDQLAGEVQLGSLTLSDVLAQLQRPGRDPRESLPQPIFKRGVLKLEDLTSGMELHGTVLNVVDFGAFVDIGLKDSGLVHISQLANRYVPDPHQVVSVGDTVHVWVLEIDKQRHRVSLTMIEPGTRRPAENRRGPQERRAEGRRPPKPHTSPAGGTQPADGQAAGSQAANAQPASGAPAGQPPRPRFRKPPPSHARPGGQKKPMHAKTEFKPKPKPKPKPVVPLTKDMKEGKAPLRTFGDLQQFWAMKHTDDEPQEPADKPS